MCDNLSITTKRLRELIDNYEKQGDNHTRTTIKDSIHCDLSTITKHYNGDREVNSDFIVRYAKFFNVSADYLLGLSDAPTSDKELQGVCDYTWLSPNAVKKLHDDYEIIKAACSSEGLSDRIKTVYSEDRRKLLSDFIANGHLSQLIEIIHDYSLELKSAAGLMESAAITLREEYQEAEQNALSGSQQSSKKQLTTVSVSDFDRELKLYLFEMQELPKSFAMSNTIEPYQEYLTAQAELSNATNINYGYNIRALALEKLREAGDQHGNDQEAE